MLKYQILNIYQFNQIVRIFMIILMHLISEKRLKNPIMKIFYKKSLRMHVINSPDMKKYLYF